MSTHIYRDSAMRLGSRDFIRQCLPQGKLGFSVEDLDLSLRIFGTADPVGKIRLIENKTGTNEIGTSKQYHFGLVDYLMRKGDDKKRFYIGYFVVNTPSDDWSNCKTFYVNGVRLTQGEFKRWLWGGALQNWLTVPKTVLDPDAIEAYQRAREASFYRSVDIKPYKFPDWIVAKIAEADESDTSCVEKVLHDLKRRASA